MGTGDPSYAGCSEQQTPPIPPNVQNRISAFGYDAAGNTLNDTVNSYAYNAESEMTSAAGVNYLYDGDGRRVAKLNGSGQPTKVYWYGSGGSILAETNNSGAVTAEYAFFGGQRIAMLPSSAPAQYYVEDMLGSSRIVTTNTGVVCYDADFYPYGGERTVTNSCTQNKYKFEGKERDDETLNDNFGARYYSWRFGRWLSADWSAVPAPVPYANLTNPQTLNLYAMVADDPETFADLDGHANSNELCPSYGNCDSHDEKKTLDNKKVETAQDRVDNEKVGKTTVGALEKIMSNEDKSLSTPKNGDPGELEKGKTALANAIINNAELDHPAKVAPATGTATSQDAQIMRDAYTNRANGGTDPVQGRTQFGTSHNGHLKSRSAGTGLKGKAGRETVFAKFGPFKDSTSRRPTYIYIYNDPGQ